MSKFSVVIVTHRRKELLIKCLDSIRGNQVKPYEIIVGINGEDNETIELLKNYKEVAFFSVPKQTPGEVRNIAIEKCIGDYLVFLDDDIVLPHDYFKIGLNIVFNHSALDVIGGPDSTPPEGSYLEQALGVTLDSPLATAKTRRRHSSPEKDVIINSGEEEHILCNLWIRRFALVSSSIRFDSRFFRNEENVLLLQLKKEEYRFGYFPKLFVFHKRRATIKGASRAVFSSGKHRMRQFVYFPYMFSPLYLVPGIFVIYLALLPIMRAEYCYLLYFYFLLSCLVSIILIWVKQKRAILFFGILFFQMLINICYGCGLVFEILTRPLIGLYGLVRTPRKN